MAKMMSMVFGIGFAMLSAGCPGTGGGGGNTNQNNNGNTNANTNTNTNDNSNQNTNTNTNANANANDNDDGGVGTDFEANLNGGQEVPPVITSGSGDGILSLSADETEIAFLFTASGLTGSVTAAHFHQGPEGADGAIVIDISNAVTQVGNEVVIDGTAAVTSTFVDSLRDGDIYINLHTELNPDGEIRGQLSLVP